ncbi:F-box/kelch-repeat protein SKIP6-like [Phragmites australis]|uniref:F-box/kelch-repeat protein SKIP6-like n=1 Tax=Phragmites australis TaxID=29695 RepID=UPI002D783BC4|nr:F-box/kelch-repeat protein SKIP6-like [Phragmites australis]XP_062189794.1 F-box/kelch-repeat protein SKIP6-like [Phragmites australis]XP_062189795.1 F-box/kelch-repeat protein SKIP6-like [Phragmites australis]
MSTESTSTPPPTEVIRGSLIPALPDDLSVHCIALLPRAAHSSLALVSRAFHALLCRHPEPLLAARRRLHLSDPHILLSLRPPYSASLLFFLLLPHPGWPPLPLPSPPIPVSSSSSAAADECQLFLVGGSVSGVPAASVQVLDPRTRSWSVGPRLSSPREFAAAVAHAGVLFVAGGCVPSSPFWAEALDLSSQNAKWKTVASPPHLREKWMHGCASLSGKVLAVADRGGLAYDPAAPPAEAWAPVSPVLDMGWKGRAAVVGGILYSYDYLGQVKGYDPDTDSWSTVEGLERELPRFLCGATLANVGGLLYLVWEGKWKGRGKGKGEFRSMVVIDWAIIEVTRAEERQLRGKVVSRDTVLFPDSPRGSAITHCLALEL